MWVKIGPDVLNLHYVESAKLRGNLVRLYAIGKKSNMPHDLKFHSDKDAKEMYEQLVTFLEKSDAVFDIGR